MTADPVVSLDHVGVAVRDLEAARRSYERLGFRLTPLSRHVGAREPGGPVLPLGSGNHCAMLKEGYLELIGEVDPTLWSSARDMLARYEGLHILALRVADAERVWPALQVRAPGLEAPRILRRDIMVDGMARTVEFRNIVGRTDVWPEMRLIVIEHRTPDLLWRPDLLDHPNGAVALVDVTFAVTDLNETVDRLSRLAGGAPMRPEPGVAVLQLAHGTLTLLDRAALARRLPGMFAPRPPCPVGFTVRVRDLSTVRRLLTDNGVSFADRDGMVQIDPAMANGAYVAFAAGEDEAPSAVR